MNKLRRALTLLFSVLFVFGLTTGCTSESSKKLEETKDTCEVRMPQDFDEGDMSITFYDDGFLKDLSVVSDNYYVDVEGADADSQGMVGYEYYEIQEMEFYSDKDLKKVVLNFDENNSLFYYKDSLGNVTFELSPNFEYLDKGD